MQGPQFTGGISGRITTFNTTIGIANAYVAVVNASNTSQAYYAGQANPQGFFQFTNINNTFNLASGAYQPRYKIYANASLFGEGYSNNFSVEANSTAAVNTIIVPLPAHVQINSPKTYVSANGTDNLQLSAYVTDAVNGEVADNCQVTFTINDGCPYSQAYNGSFKATPCRTVTVGTVNGYANVTFGWVMSGGTDKSSVITATCGSNQAISNSIRIYLHKSVVTPPLSWFKTYGGNKTDIGYSVRQISDGGYIIAGMAGYTGGGNSNGYLIKTDASGNRQWDRIFNEIGIKTVNDLQQTDDGGFILAGGNSDYSTYLIKTDRDGTTEWTRTFNNYGDNVNALQKTADGGYVMTGRTYASGSGDMYLSKFTSDGTLQWSRTFGGAGDDSGYSVQQTRDGGFILVGYYDTSSPYGDLRVNLIKTDASGNSQWSKVFSATVREFGHSVRQTDDGGYVITGYSIVSDRDVDVILMRTDASGDILWRKNYDVAGCDYSNSVQLTPDGGFVIAGNTDPYGLPFLIKTDAGGNRLWTKTMGVEFDEAFSVILSSDGGYVVVGDTASNGSVDVFLAKIGGLNVTVAGNTPVPAGTSFQGTVTISDPEGDTWGATVDYGDGTLPAHINMAAQSFALPGHVYSSEGNYTLCVTVRNNFGASSSARTIIAVSGSRTWDMSLHEGWNLVSIPLTPVNSNITSVIPPEAMANIRIIWYYDNTNPNAPAWKFYKPGRAVNTLTNLTDGMGFWILANNNISFTVAGKLPKENHVIINRGWNMVGPEGLSTHTSSDQYGTYHLTWGFNNGQWYYYKPSRAVNTLTEIKPGLGYWVLVS